MSLELGGRNGEHEACLVSILGWKEWIQKTPRLTSCQHWPRPGLKTWGLVIWGTVLHSSPLFVLLPQNGPFFLRVPENGELFCKYIFLKVKKKKKPSLGHSGSNSFPAWVMSLGPSALVPVNKPRVIAARTVSSELHGGRVMLSRGLSESLPTLGVFQTS